MSQQITVCSMCVECTKHRLGFHLCSQFALGCGSQATVLSYYLVLSRCTSDYRRWSWQRFEISESIIMMHVAMPSITMSHHGQTHCLTRSLSSQQDVIAAVSCLLILCLLVRITADLLSRSSKFYEDLRVQQDVIAVVQYSFPSHSYDVCLN